MKSIHALFCFILLIGINWACSRKEPNTLIKPKRVVVAGKILNVDPDRTDVYLAINRPGFDQEKLYAPLDTSGIFQFEFMSYGSNDAWVGYKTNFLILTHPGDSIYVEFDGQPWWRPKILKTIQFGGDAKISNELVAEFQHMYFSNPLYKDKESKKYAIENYNLGDYQLYLDSLDHKCNALHKEFINRIDPNKETILWASTFLRTDYNNALVNYLYEHLQIGRLEFTSSEIPLSYYEAFKKSLPLSDSLLVSGHAINEIINKYHFFYINAQILNDTGVQKYKNENGRYQIPRKVHDSLFFHYVLEESPDDLLRQFILTDFFKVRLEAAEFETYERNLEIIDTYIVNPYLSQPLTSLYNEVKARIENPKIATEAILKKFENSSIEEIKDSIFHANLGNVTYIDCWSTWCGPCRAEFPNSVRLMKTFEDENVEFVYICLNSDEDQWKASLDEFKLGGKHILLTRKQSGEFIDIFGINGVPFYLLVDSKGNIIEQGSHLRPASMKGKIAKLLENG